MFKLSYTEDKDICVIIHETFSKEEKYKREKKLKIFIDLLSQF